MNNIIPVYKPLGLTSLQCIKLLMEKCPELKDKKATFAGRLDPMAEGVLLVLLDEARFEKEKYLNLNKVYEADLLFGFKSDTYDLLGEIIKVKKSNIDQTSLSKYLGKLVGQFEQKLPPYSSFRIKGKSLFEWSREGKIDQIDIPTKNREIYLSELLGFWTEERMDLYNKVSNRINLVDGDFRQKIILEKWKQFLLDGSNYKLQCASIRINCSSGTYIRSIINDLGDFLNCGALSLRIKRISVGEFNESECVFLN